MPGPLAGIRVVALTHFAAGPIAAQYLGSLGADVIKVESPNPDILRSVLSDKDGRLNGVGPHFVAVNRNQRSIVIDLKKPEGIEIACKLVATADVLIENFRPGVLDRLGLAYEDVSKFNPTIIYGSVSAFDLDGPGRDRPGQDLLLQAQSGLASLTGRGDYPPVAAGAYIIDTFAGVQLVVGVLAALQHRAKTGEGQRLRTDMMSAALFLMAQEASCVMNIGAGLNRGASTIAHVHQPAPYGIYPVKDGAVAIASFAGPHAIRRLAEALGVLAEIESLLSPDNRQLDRDGIADALARGLKQMTAQEATAAIGPTAAWAVPVQTLDEALEDPAVVASGIVQEIDSAYGGKYKIVAEPLKMDRTPLTTRQPAPAHGQHSRDLLLELGMSETDIARALSKGAVLAELA
ncbi:CaiB/BaiF CoA transferase family protein [Sinorhizobium medicae]|uniref:CaiB/BaiF CoA transferase family protein n=1 Tax=Sinorhizobium medicae TaxID=110321 RepID=UPI000FDA287E|nr:CaiB/BaiF CoA-transferase family protein [Sinorhizobium medicae]RVO73535.1 CoA transferase [Sinorhizobium medicae]